MAGGVSTELVDLKKTQIADLIYRQKTKQEIAEIMSMSGSQVNRYIVAIREEWQEHRIRTAEQHFDESLARLAFVEAKLMPSIINGYVPAFDRWLVLNDQRNKLLGLYAPTKSELDIGEQLTRLLTKISTEPEPEPLALPPFVEGQYEDVSEMMPFTEDDDSQAESLS